MVLYLDVGNTRTKWLLLDCDGIRIGSGSFLVQDSHYPIFDYCEQVNEIVIASVAGSEIMFVLLTTMESRFRCNPRILTAEASFDCVVNGYDNPSQLGVDRWLAVVAAYHRYQQACVVIDLGSAITVDYVDINGHHSGGLIAPGVSSLYRVLQQKTQLASETSATCNIPSLASNTSQAIQNGVGMMVLGLIEQVLRLSDIDDDAVVLLTGGDAKLLKCVMPTHWQIDEDLVFKGMQLVTAKKDVSSD